MEKEPTTRSSDTYRTDHDRNVPEIDLLSPLTIRGITLRLSASALHH